ncbi:chromobox protein homolog 5 [Nilaparvata lugens]|uniref:chromobox protein homolog 5 n=1 Tax=Nilaparvata lugens TaxID=108931 RepID=UPI000B97E591|nr:chromobox protein homolog 5 [Nilaparvata lugens]XP_039299066.1 chromobox protein homolog 5 [Nilaparvata lugens]
MDSSEASRVESAASSSRARTQDKPANKKTTMECDSTTDSTAAPTRKSKSAVGEQGSSGTAAKEYEVEDILDHMVVQDKSFFLVKWKNYDQDSNSWESRDDLTNCKRAIANYFKRSLTNYENLKKQESQQASSNKQ